jgi:hypothetical protein
MSNSHRDRARVYVSAIFCADIIRESATDLLTAVRITNAFTATPARFTPKLPDAALDVAHQELIYKPVTFHAVINFWAESSCSFEFMLGGTKPNGEPLAGMGGPMPIEIPGDGGSGHTLNLTASLPGSLAGVYWFEFLVDSEIALKLPMSILHGSESPESMYSSQPAN